MKLLWLIGIFIYAYPDMLKDLSVFQGCRYQKGRYYDWMKEHLLVNWHYFIFWCLPWLIGMLFRRMECALLLLLIYASVNLKQKKAQIVRPKMTARMKRLFVMQCVLQILLGNFIINNVLAYIYGALMVYVTWGLTLCSAMLLTPLEQAIKRYYVIQAKRKLTRFPNLHKIGITGSYGKTSTKQILSHLLALEYDVCASPASFNNEMGLTRTILETLKPRHQVMIAEMGADHVGEITALANFIQPQIGVITGIGPQHIQTFGGMKEITHEKAQLIETLGENGVGILNMDQPYLSKQNLNYHGKLIRYGIDRDDVELKAVNIQVSKKGTDFIVLYQNEVVSMHTRLLGKQHVSNILGAIACALVLGLTLSQLKKRVETLPEVAHRLQLRAVKNYHIIDNAYNSNPTSAAYALEVLSQLQGRKIIMTPGFIDLGEYQAQAHHNFGKQIAMCVQEVILVGRYQIQAIYQGLLEAGYERDHIHIASNREQAFSILNSIVLAGDVVLIENDLPILWNR